MRGHHRGRPCLCAVVAAVLWMAVTAAPGRGQGDAGDADVPQECLGVETSDVRVDPEPLCIQVLELDPSAPGIVGHVGRIGVDLDRQCSPIDLAPEAADVAEPVPTSREGIANVTVTLLGPGPNDILGDEDDAVERTTTSGVAGCYAFVDLAPNTRWRVEVPPTLPDAGLAAGCAEGGAVRNASTATACATLRAGPTFGYESTSAWWSWPVLVVLLGVGGALQAIGLVMPVLGLVGVLIVWLGGHAVMRRRSGSR